MRTAGPPPLLAKVGPSHWLVLDWVVAGAYAIPALFLLVNLASGTASAFAVPVELAAFTLPVALRRRHPVLGIGVLLGALSFVGLLEPRAVLLGLLPLAYVLYIAAATARPRTAMLALVASLGAAAATALPDFRHLGAAALFSFLYIVVWALGFAVALHRRYTEDLLGYQARIAEAELQGARDKVAQERIRIARELHDIVAHGMSVITVQAGYGNLVLDDDPEAARASLRAIETTGRQTLTEMRSLLMVLRQDGPSELPHSPNLAPAPGLASLDGLLEETAKAGLQVAVTITGRRRPLPAGIDLAAYRIVQEALTNVVKHAETDFAKVWLDFQARELTIEITDEGAGSPAAGCPPPGPTVPGHGMVGIRERVHLYGGTFRAQPLPGRGFQVICHIPLTADTRENTPSAAEATTA